MTHYRVRRAVAGDARGIADCLSAAFERHRDDYTPTAYEDTVATASAIARRLESMCLFVAVTDRGDIVGTVGYRVIERKEGHIRGMAVRPGCQGSAAARVLLDAVEDDLRRRKCTRITLGTTAPLERAIAFYEKNGFKASGKVGDFHGMPLFEYVKVLPLARPGREGRRQ